MGPRDLILHVENDDDDVFLVQRAMTKVGIANPIRAVANGEQAVTYLNADGAEGGRSDHPRPAVILLDWNMPLMSGREFLVWLRADSRWKRIPVVVLTSSNAERDMHEAYEVGASGFLVKPGTQDEFQTMCRAFADYWLNWNRAEYGHSPSAR